MEKKGAKGMESARAIMLEFGLCDMAPRRWDGSVSISEGTIVKIRGHHFSEDDKVNENHSWQATTKNWSSIVPTGCLNPKEIPQPHGTLVQLVGVTIYYQAPETATLRIRLKEPRTLCAYVGGWTFEEHARVGFKTMAQEFEFSPADIPECAPLPLLGGRVQVFRVPPVEQISDRDYENDYPSVAVDKAGNVWVAWVGYRNESEEILLRRLSQGSWSEPVKVTEKPGDLFSTAMAADGKSRIWIVWSEREDGNWHLMARSYNGNSWSHIQKLISGQGNNLFHRLTRDPNGNLHLVWQGFRGGRFDIFLKSLIGDSWSEGINLSDPNKDERCNDWMPAAVVDRSGTVWVAWDSYASGSYNILLRAVRNGKAGELFHVTNSLRFHAHVSLIIDDENRLWVAYDEAEENWGKDTGFLFEGGAGLYQSRRIRFAILSDGKWFEPLDDLNKVVPAGIQKFLATPRLISDGKGRMWVLFRSRTSANVQMTRFAVGGKWEVMASYYCGDRWSAPMRIPESLGRNEGPFDVTADGEEGLWVAWTRRPSHHENNNDILVCSLSAISAASMDFGPRSLEPPARRATEPHEKEQVAQVRNYTIQVGGKTYKIYRGDLHRHTEISGDGAGEGSLWDAYRYMLDAANLDFGMVADHNGGGSGGREYTWWRIEKAVDMFHVPDFFVPLFGYEPGLDYPSGHSNVVFAHRGVRILPPQPGQICGRSGPFLYPYLRKNGGIAIPHTSASINMGTDWRGNDPKLEPLVEIFQGARTSAEHEGAPLAPAGKRPDLRAGEVGGYQKFGWVWNAWSKGYKLGVIASSDHISTHCSYACILAEDGTRQGLLDAMRRRHTYAATSNIIMDFRLRDASGEHLMGDEILAGSIPELLVKIIGTAPIRKVRVIRDNQYVYCRKGSGERIEFSYRENSLIPGEHYYYVRMEQVDGNVAWASPIWVKYQP